MTTFTIAGTPAQILFAHREMQRMTENGTETVDVTMAMVVDLDGFPIPGTTVGTAIRNPNEPDNKWEGRGWALARAVSALRLDHVLTVKDAFEDAHFGWLVTEQARKRELTQLDAMLDEHDRLADQAHTILNQLDAAEDAILDRQAALACQS